MMTFFEEMRMEFAYRNGVRELSAALNKDLGDLIQDCVQRHLSGDEVMKKPTLWLWADTDGEGKISVRVEFADYRKRCLKGSAHYTLCGASYQEVAEKLSTLCPTLCEYDSVSALVQSARPRLEAKHFGEAE